MTSWLVICSSICRGMGWEREDLAVNRAEGNLRRDAGSPGGARCLMDQPDAVCSSRGEKNRTHQPHAMAPSCLCAAPGLLLGSQPPSWLQLRGVLGAR